MPKLTTGSKTVTAAGTRERLVAVASSVSVRGVSITAKPTNTGKVYLGDSTVASTNTPPIAAGDDVALGGGDPLNLADIYIDVQVSGEGVDWIAVDA